MRRISLAVALLGAIAGTACSGGSNPSSSGTGRGVPGSTYTVLVRGDGYWFDPVSSTTVNRPRFGTVTSSPAGISCGPAATACSADFPWGSSVSLTAAGSTGYGYHAFAGDCSGNAGCAVSGNSDKMVVVRFAQTSTGLNGHPNWSQGALHGPEFQQPRTWDCKTCHGDQLQGLGLAFGCAACHSQGTVDALNAYYDAPAPAANTEQCGSCHSSSATAGVHALSDLLGVTVSVVSDPELVGSDVRFTFNVKVNGANSDDFTSKAAVVANHNEDAWWVYNAATASGERTKISPLGNFTLAAVGGGTGNYTVTLPGLQVARSASGISAVSPGAAYMISTRAPSGAVATVVAYFPGVRPHDVVGDQACINCHGALIWREAAHDVTHPQGVGPCVVCHNRTGSADPRLPGLGTGLLGIVHGVHSSHNMPDGVYTFTWTNGNKFNFSVGFPGFMNNCSTCHDSAARLAAVKDAPVSYALCISCHDDFSAFPAAPADHLAFTTSQACGCHAGQTVSTHHNGLMTERAGLIWAGDDVSVTEGAKIAMAITGTSIDPAYPSSIVITWTAAQNGTAVNPCNTDVNLGPIFHAGGAANAATGKVASNLSVLRSYAQGDDFLGGPGSSPGQPASAVSLTTANTTCSGDVATTIVNKESTTATRGLVALQGKPQIRFAPAAGTAHEVIQVRAASPVREFNPQTGGDSGSTRRQIVSTAKCLKCHEGSLYQHGGNRVDSVDLCIMCHNPASNEGNVRFAFGVTPAEAYDGKVGETYELKTMVHAIHSAGETGELLVYYRTNGIYAFGSQAAIDAIPNWPGPGSFAPFGANIDPTPRNHNEIVVHYPQPLNACDACHVNGSENGLPNQTQAMAATLDPGALSTASGNSVTRNQLDDVLMGSTAAACFTCHQSGDPAVQAALRSHGYGFGWTPQAFPNGRQTIIDAATP